MLSLVDREKNIFCYLLKNKNESEYMYVHNTFLFLMLLSCVGDRNSHCISELSMNEHDGRGHNTIRHYSRGGKEKSG